MTQDFFPHSRFIILIITGIGCFGAGFIFHIVKKPKKQSTPIKFVTLVPTKWERIKTAIYHGIVAFDIVFAFVLPILTWQFAWIDSYAYMVITYWDMLMIAVFYAGIYMVRMLIRQRREDKEEVK